MNKIGNILYKMRNLLLISSSRVHGFNYLEASEAEIKSFLSNNNISTILFIPYASNDYPSYLNLVKPVLKIMGYHVDGIHEFDNPVDAVEKAEAIFIGGGNTFLLLKTLYDNNLISVIQRRVLQDGVSYIGSSAGTNVAAWGINTTNDMPIVYPPSFEALQLVPFNINPHYIESENLSTHKGETRDQRIAEYISMPNSKHVLALREGCMLHVTGNKAILKGVVGAKLFYLNGDSMQFDANTDVSFLLEENK